MSESHGRRKWSASEKLRIVSAGMQAGDFAELCRREGVSPTQYYGSKKQLPAAAGQGSGRWRSWASRRGATTAAAWTT
jgi:transposase-like protein